MSHETYPLKGRNLATFLSGVLFLTYLTLIWSGWHVYQTYDSSQTASERQLQVSELRGVIVHLHEILSMSTQMAVATGDLKWEQRYRQYEATLAAVIQKSQLYVSAADKGAASVTTDSAKMALTRIENSIFLLVRKGDLSAAKVVLLSNEYIGQQRVFEQGMTRFGEHSAIYLRLGDLRNAILYLDEVLTMSARMAVVTGDQQWERRYRRFEPTLGTAINEAIALAPNTINSKAAVKTDAANIALVEMENRAFAQVRNGQTDEAKAILFSEEYKAQKRIYAEGMLEFANAISSVISTEWKQQQQRALYRILPFFFIIPLLILAWIIVFRAVGKWRLILKTSNHRLARQSEELVDKASKLNEFNESLQTEIGERKQVEEQLAFQASHDGLTGLLNRKEFERRASRLFETVRRDKCQHALCFMDLDQFKVVNDTCGHVAGDELLRQLSLVLKKSVRQGDLLARLGGDEFAVLMEHTSLDDAQWVAALLQKAIQDYQFSWEGRNFKVGVSMGLVPIAETSSNLVETLSDADAACYVAKDKGRNRIHVYHAEDTETTQRHGEMQWVGRLNHALDDNRFCIYAQAIAPLDGRSELHYELLVRMLDDDGNIIPPGAFLPVAERYNLISKVDCWVVEHIFSRLLEYPVFLDRVNCLSINLSGQSVAEEGFQGFLIEQLATKKIPPEKICFEITETAAITNMNSAISFISRMKELGCQFALDDFGSGLSSFGYLKNLPVNYLKIDGMFVRDIVDDPIDHAMVKSINEVGHVMGMQTIAEFVENDEIQQKLIEIGVDYAQGYGIGKPHPFDELIDEIQMLADNRESIVSKQIQASF